MSEKNVREIKDPVLIAMIDATTKIMDSLPEGVSCSPGYAMHVYFRGQKIDPKPPGGPKSTEK